ncbi:MAG: methyltransferase [Methylovulum sp.]|nr:MAG: methyltransferase [Methylovulum sp.]
MGTINANDDEQVSFAPAGPYLPPAEAGPGRDNFVAELIDDPARNGLMQWLARLLFVQLRELSPDIKAGAAGTAAAWFDNAGVLELYQRWWRQSLTMLADYGYLQRQGAEFNVSESGRGIADKAAVWQAWQNGKQLYLDNSETQALVRLLDDCLSRLPDILRGAVQATDVLFPGSSMEKVLGIYKNSAQVDYFNTVLAESAAAFVRQRLAADPAARIRIIEIGAGTGGTTAMVLHHLRPFSAHIDEYGYTDISKAFLQHGETQYGGEYPFLNYRLWNIEQPPADQGIATGVYDLVIAANVLHATQDIRQTLRHAKAALHQHGLMLLNEISDTSLLSHLSFGLLKGWWLYRDPALRMPGSPGLYPEAWRDVLEEEGFGSVLFPAQSAHGLGQQIIAAVSDGVVRRKIHAVAQEPAVEPGRDHQPVRATLAGGVNVKDIVRRQIQGSLVQALKAPEGSIDNDVPFSDYGIDSILGVGFVKQVNEGLGITMNTAIIFDYATVNQLAAYVLQTYGKDLGKRAAVEPDEQLAEQFFSGELSVESLLDSVMLQDVPGFGVES